jgi:hypothetical protein
MLVVAVVDQTYLIETELAVLAVVVLVQLALVVLEQMAPIPLVVVAVVVGMIQTLLVDMVDQVSQLFVIKSHQQALQKQLVVLLHLFLQILHHRWLERLFTHLQLLVISTTQQELPSRM